MKDLVFAVLLSVVLVLLGIAIGFHGREVLLNHAKSIAEDAARQFGQNLIQDTPKDCHDAILKALKRR